MSLKIALSDLMNKMKKAGDEHLPKSYAIGKGYAAAKSGYEVMGSPLDSEVVAARVGFNEEKIIKMVNEMEEKILAIKPSAYASTTEYMADVDRIFNTYAGRAHAYAYYSEQLFLDGWVQGGREIAGELGDEWNMPEERVGFFWRVVGDERTCQICWDLNGNWYPLGYEGELLDLTWEAHIGCRCPDYFEFGVNPY